MNLVVQRLNGTASYVVSNLIAHVPARFDLLRDQGDDPSDELAKCAAVRGGVIPLANEVRRRSDYEIEVIVW